MNWRWWVLGFGVGAVGGLIGFILGCIAGWNVRNSKEEEESDGV